MTQTPLCQVLVHDQLAPLRARLEADATRFEELAATYQAGSSLARSFRDSAARARRALQVLAEDDELPTSPQHEPPAAYEPEPEDLEEVSARG